MPVFATLRAALGRDQRPDARRRGRHRMSRETRRRAVADTGPQLVVAASPAQPAGAFVRAHRRHA